jgi:hypothetical protein
VCAAAAPRSTTPGSESDRPICRAPVPVRP